MRRALAAVAALSALVAGCGGAQREPNLAKASERTEATGSARIEVRGFETVGGRELEFSCEGVADYARQRSRFVCESTELGTSETIASGDLIYVRSEGTRFATTKPWLKVPGEGLDLLDVFSPEKLLANLRSVARETERVGEDEVRGVSTVHHRLIVDREGETAPLDVWIDADGLIRRIEMDLLGVTGTIEFFDFGVDVDVEPPRADDVTDIDAARCRETGAPIREDQAIDVLRHRGFSVRRDEPTCGFRDVASVLTNTPALQKPQEEPGDVLAREGHVSCFVFVTSPAGAPKTVVRRGAEGADAELLLANLRCTILADSPNAEERIDRLEEAFAELQRTIRP